MDKPSPLDDLFPPHRFGGTDNSRSRDTDSFFDYLLRTTPYTLPTSPASSEIPNLAPPPPPPPAPPKPKQWTRNYLQNEIIRRIDMRANALQRRLGAITRGLTMPDLDRIPVGSGRQFELAIMFLDIVGFTKLPNANFEDQRNTLAMLHLFTGEMMQISREYTGVFEKNTGDGMMAYFGTETKDAVESVRRAVDAALVMNYVHHNHINPLFLSKGWPAINFRIAIDYGPVTVARVGARSGLSSFVAIGDTANTACRLMRLLPNGGIALGHRAAELIPQEWQRTCVNLGPIKDSYWPNGEPYGGWELGHRLSYPLR